MSDSTSPTTEASQAPRRHYPPGVVFHAPHCIGGGSGAAVPVRAAFEAHPNRLVDACFAQVIPHNLTENEDALAEILPYVSIEIIPYARHPYVASDPRDPNFKQPPDAIRPLCKICRGTHGGEA